MANQGLPLAGVRVLELTHVVAGPTAGMLLADLGADVCKVEHPTTGDTARNQHNSGGTFLPLNRNKKSIALDLRSEDGKEVFRRLVERADVVIDNLAPGALDRLGVDYDWGSQVNPRIIYCSIKGFLDGPYADRPLLDELAQMMGGLAFVTGFPGQPLRAGASIIDMGAATYGVLGLLAALYRRQETGRGDNVRAGLFETVVFFMTSHFTRAQLTGQDAQPRAGRESGMGNFMGWGVYQLFPTRDGRPVFIAVTSNRLWKRLCEVLGYDDWGADPKYDDDYKRTELRKEIAERISATVRELEFSDITKRLYESGIPFAPVNSVKDLFDEPHLQEGGYWFTVDVPSYSGLKMPTLPITLHETEPVTVRLGPPQLGEHTDAVLKELGYSTEEIETLKQRKVVRRSDQTLQISTEWE